MQVMRCLLRLLSALPQTGRLDLDNFGVKGLDALRDLDDVLLVPLLLLLALKVVLIQ